MSYSKSKPSNYVTKEQIERARNVDMVEFLERTEGFSVKKSGNGYRCDVHDSLFITNDRKASIGELKQDLIASWLADCSMEFRG